MMKRLLLAILLLPPAVLFAGQVAQIGIIGPIAPKVTVTGSVNTPQIAVIGTKPLELKVYTPTATTANVVIPGMPGPPGKDGKDGASGASTWNDISGKPDTFPPAAHNQAISTVTGLQTALDGKQAVGSYQTAGDYATNGRLDNYSAAVAEQLAQKATLRQQATLGNISASKVYGSGFVSSGTYVATSGNNVLSIGPTGLHLDSLINEDVDFPLSTMFFSTSINNLAFHLRHYENPHATTAAQVGAPTVAEMSSALATKADKGGSGSFGNYTFAQLRVKHNGTFIMNNVAGNVGAMFLNGANVMSANYYTGRFLKSTDYPGPEATTKDIIEHLSKTNNPHAVTAAQLSLATVATSGSYTDLINQPTILRGYDGREIELRTNATHIQWRYLDSATWTDLTPLSAITGPAGSNGTNGTNGDTYVCAITGGIRSLLYDKDSHNPTPAMVPFSVEVRKNGAVVTPDSYAWSVPASGSLLSGSSTTSTFTPTVNSLFSAGSADNRVDVVVTYSGITCRATAPVPATRVGDTGAQGSPDTKTDIYGKITTAVNGDVLNTQAGSGDADSFAFRTVRAKGGDIHRTDLAVGQTWIHARPTDAASAPKLGIKNSSGTPVMQFNADGSFTGTLVIR